MWVECFAAMVQQETDATIAARVCEAGGSVGRQAVGQWRKGKALPTRRNLVALFQAFGACETERGRVLRAWLDADNQITPPIDGRVIAVIDTETTGLPEHDWAGVCEVGIVILDAERRELGRFQMLTHPPILDGRSSQGFKIHRIEQEQIKQAPGHQATVIAIRQFLRAWGYPPLVAFNAKFDQQMLERAGLVYRDWYCLKEAAAARFGHIVSLDKCCSLLDIERSCAHRALGDAIDAARVVVGLEL